MELPTNEYITFNQVTEVDYQTPLRKQHASIEFPNIPLYMEAVIAPPLQTATAPISPHKGMEVPVSNQACHAPQSQAFIIFNPNIFSNLSERTISTGAIPTLESLPRVLTLYLLISPWLLPLSSFLSLVDVKFDVLAPC